MNNKNTHGIRLALLAAVLYALNAPFSKLLLAYVPSTIMAGLLYLGAGAGMVLIQLYRKHKGDTKELHLTAAEFPYTAGMILLDIAAPVSLMYGLARTTAANASLLNNFEITATALIAFALFGEKISGRLAAGILFVTFSCCLLSLEDLSAFTFSKGSLFVLLAAVFWGLENNCTRKLSAKDPLEIVLLKGIFSGSGSLLIGFLTGERITVFIAVPFVLLLGLCAYGLSIYCYVYAQRELGASRTSAYYAAAPFIGVILSLIIFHEIPTAGYYAALILMLAGAWLCADDRPLKETIKPLFKH